MIYIATYSWIPLSFQCANCKFLFIDQLVKTLVCVQDEVTKIKIEYDDYSVDKYDVPSIGCEYYIKICSYCLPIFTQIINKINDDYECPGDFTK
jgi:hypothetical protein